MDFLKDMGFKLETSNEITVSQKTVLLIVLMFAAIFAIFFLFQKISS